MNKIKKIFKNKKILLILLIIIILIIIFLLYSFNILKTKPKKETKQNHVNYSYYVDNEGNGEYVTTQSYNSEYRLQYIKCNGTKMKHGTYSFTRSTGAFSINGISEASKCNLYFSNEPTLLEKLMTNNSSVAYTTTPGQEISTTNEGLIEGPNDDYGDTTYYFRGNVQNNYVRFAALTWRIVRINGDGSIRLVLNTPAEKTSAWNTISVNSTFSTALTYATYNTSKIKKSVDAWYNENIGNNINYSNKVVPTKFCSDRTYTAEASYNNFGALNRLVPVASAAPSFICPTNSAEGNDIYNLNAGLLTADEVAFAGGAYGILNTSYYLYKPSTYWWTMSPYYWEAGIGIVHAMTVYNNGTLGYNNRGYLTESLPFFPVISLSTDTLASANTTNPGTVDNPYVVH